MQKLERYLLDKKVSKDSLVHFLMIISAQTLKKCNF